MRHPLFQAEPLYLLLTDEISQITKDDDDVLSTENGYLMGKSDKLAETKIHSIHRIINYN